MKCLVWIPAFSVCLCAATFLSLPAADAAQIPNAPLGLTTNGAGRVTPLTNGQRLEIGRRYTIRATPAPGNLFSNWTGTITSTNPVLSFIGESDTRLTANFVPNPFIALKGRYTGLIYLPNQPAHENGAFFTFTLTDKGRFSGRLILAGATLVGSGAFGLNLRSQTPIFNGTGRLLALQLNVGSDRIVGVITNQNSTNIAGIADGYRATFSASNAATQFAGRHTVLLSRGPNAATSPYGWGAGTVDIATNGAVIFKGTLADNTPFTQSFPLSFDGRFPIYLPLYGGRGSLFGWLNAGGVTSNSLSGSLRWARSAPSRGPFYQTVFDTNVLVRANRFDRQSFPTNFSNCFARFEGGNLENPLTQAASFTPPASASFPPFNPDRIALRYNPATGLFTGSFKNYATGRTSPIKAILLQEDGFAAGFFLGANQTGAFFLGQESSFPPFPPAP